MSNFKGIETEAARNSIPQGSYQDLTNVDNTNLNRARHRQGLSRVSRNNLLTEDILTSGELAYDFLNAPASGSPASGTSSPFLYPVVSGVHTTHDASGNWLQIARVGEKIYGQRLGDYINGDLFGGSEVYWALGVDYQEERDGTYDTSVYNAISVAGWASGSIPNGNISPYIGVAVNIQPDIDSWYAGWLVPGSFGGGEVLAWVPHIVKVQSGVLVANLQGSSMSPPEQSGLLMIEVVDNQDETALVKLYFQNTLVATFSDNLPATYGFILASGFPGIGGVHNSDTSGSTYNYLAPVGDGGSTASAQVGGGLNASQPSGFASAMIAQQAHGKLHYHYVDASGNFIILEDPVVES